MCGGVSSVNRSHSPARNNDCHSSQPLTTTNNNRHSGNPFAQDVNECGSHRRHHGHHGHRRAHNNDCASQRSDSGLKKFFDDLIGRLRSSTPAAEQPPAAPPAAAPPATTPPPAAQPEPLATPRNQPPLPAAPPSSQFAYPV